VPQITKITPQKSKKRVNIYLDHKFGFGLDLENYLKLGLKVEQDLSEKEIAEIVKKAEYQKTLDKLLLFSSLRPRSEREVANWFWRKKVHQSLHNKLIKKLKKLEILDDSKFASWWVKQRLEFKNKSKRELISELYSKGIDKNTIEDVLSNFKVDDEKAAKKLISKKMYKWEKYELGVKNRKIGEYLSRKGFSWDVIKKIIKRD